ncbi:MAG: DUF1559 domain-containing protein [Candidatus Omnitrophica bacterium]|nr:DUF1559 domain-containing protein [Candidatus Omnitrophota bacterium]
MLLPALARAREQARRSVCISNLKQLGLAIKMYAQDYKEFFPNSGLAITSPYLDAGARVILDLGLLYPRYVSAQKTFLCPSDLWHKTSSGSISGYPHSEGAPLLQDASGKTDDRGCSYAYAIDCNEQTDVDTVLMCDKIGFPGYRFGVSTSGIPLQPTQISQDIANHKADGVNALYAGGHVRWIPAGKMTPTEMFPNLLNGGGESGAVYNP